MGAVKLSGDNYDRIYAVVRRIPRGHVATYGQIADLAGLDGRARQVGYAMRTLTIEGVPWHRVVNARGQISARAEPGSDLIQRQLLESEGVVFDAADRLKLEDYRWRPKMDGRPRRRPRAQDSL
ncbi:MAG: MGMT family protein [Deltaproteobacteria bacterium]|jgi:methylated-DNA-protein-cysteine methyltransferase-like protein|nr:MGMT family protein [Deltaproteobacteria bacterium]MBW2543202.1 MGMT family protein [Deltaproteobacteria bacterium]